MKFSTNFNRNVNGKIISQKQANKIKAVINKDEPLNKGNLKIIKTRTELRHKIFKDKSFNVYSK